MQLDSKYGFIERLSRLISRQAGKLQRTLRGKQCVKFLYLEVTHRCNLRCFCCYTGAGAEKPDALTLAEQKSVIRQAQRMGARNVSLSGSGEPMLYPHIRELIDYIRWLGMKVTIFTNGTTLDRETADWLMTRRVETYFKLYSLDPAVFNKMVGKNNAYEWTDYDCRDKGKFRIPTGLKYLLDAMRNISQTELVGVEAVITRLNSNSLPMVAKFCKAEGVMLYLETPIFTGRAVDNYDSIAMSADEYRRLYQELAGIMGEDYFERHRRHQCLVERNPAVWTNGDIAICSSRPANVGNVRTTSLKKLFALAQKEKQKRDAAIPAETIACECFRKCETKRFYETKHGIKCDY
jgi:MoaA/NifB/PqqE/SkfB family radical SAM enzyme